jgi:CRP-like cAMP-binding protein
LNTLPGTRPCNKLLASLPVEDRTRIESHLITVPQHLKEYIYKQDEIFTDVYFPGGGACSMTKTMQDGATAEVATVGSEGVLGSCVYFGEDRSTNDAIVQVAGDGAFRMPVRLFITEMDRRGPLYATILRYSQALLTQVMQTTACNGLHSVEQRCCRWLLMTRDRVGVNDLKLTHEFLAIMLGVRRPTVTLVVGELEKLGLIDNRRGAINITDLEALKAHSCECYETVKENFARLMPEIPGAAG